jgi:chromosome segregation ATPase
MMLNSKYIESYLTELGQTYKTAGALFSNLEDELSNAKLENKSLQCEIESLKMELEELKTRVGCL